MTSEPSALPSLTNTGPMFATAVPTRIDHLAANSDIEDLSFGGAHTYILIRSDELGIPQLFYRQFSDFAPGGALFDPVFALSVIGSDGKPALVSRKSYEWLPDRVQWACAYGGILEGEQILAYTDEDSILCVMKLRSLCDEPITVKFSGCLSSKLGHVTVEPFAERFGFRMKFDYYLYNPWDYPPSLLAKEYMIATNLSALTREVRGNSYSATYRISGKSEVTVKILFTSISKSQEQTRTVLENSDVVLHRTKEHIEHWLSLLKVPHTLKANRIRMYYNAWYQLWRNIEHAEGLWKHPIISPSKTSYSRGIWLWDSGFHVFGLLHGSSETFEIAKHQIEVLVQASSLVGHLPREVWVGAPNSQIQPPGILTWAAMEIYARNKDLEFLRKIYETLAANNEWFYRNKDSNQNGLCEWAGGDSGWDTSPRWDTGETDAVDLNCWLYLDQMELSKMAQVLGLLSETSKWKKQAQKTASLIRQRFWDESDGWYYDLNAQTGMLVRVKTPAAFWTMFTGIASSEEAERMVKTLTNPDMFWTNYPIPCVAKNEPSHSPNDYWRGPTWVNLNWIVLLGLKKYGFHDIAQKLRERTLDMIAMNLVPYEYYNPDTGIGLGARNYSWTAALYLDMCMRD